MYLAALKKYTALFAAIGLLVFINSCKSSGTGPEDNVPAGRRDYVWTVDTLNKLSNYNRYSLLYGTSPSNIWCIGQGVFSTSFLHFDGKGWEFVDYHDQGSGVDPWSVFGLSPNDFWIGGAENMIWRCKNKEITKFGTYKLENFGDVYYLGFCGFSENDVYACGGAFTKNRDSVYGVLMHYNGSYWEYINKPEKPGHFLRMYRSSTPNSDIFIDTYIEDSKIGASTAIYKYNGKTLELIYREPEVPDYASGYMNVGNKLYFGFKKKIFTYENNNFHPCIDLSRYDIKSLYRLNGRSLKDFFMLMKAGIGHYNGNDIEIVFKCSSETAILSTLILEKNVYFLLSDLKTNRNLLVHGKLKE